MLAFKGLYRMLGCRRLVFFSIFGLSMILVFNRNIKPNARDMLQLDKCPACYGVSLCSEILQGSSEISIKFDYWGRFGLLANTIVTKNVYSGHLNSKKVIIKRLGYDSELSELDVRICRFLGNEENCNQMMKEAVFRVPNLRDSVKQLLTESPNFNDFRTRLCPSTEKVDQLFSTILPKNNASKPRLTNDGHTANIWTLLLINPEPLLLQILRAEDGWPVPYYLGACGRISVTLNAGEPLIDFLDKSWPERAGLALQLLLAADRFTYSHPRFAFYLLDISADNIVVNEHGKLSFVDLEHTIIVDRHPSTLPDMWNKSHVTESYEDCPGCSIFSSHALCNHHTSDHNHYMICLLLAPGTASNDNLLPGGLLQSMPSQIQSHYPQIQAFLQECSSGSGIDRIRSARRLRDALNIASKESPLFGDPSLMQSWKYF